MFDYNDRNLVPRQFMSYEEMERTHAAERRIWKLTEDATSPLTKKRIKMRAISVTVAAEYGLDFDDLMKATKIRKIAHARFEAWREIYESRDDDGKRIFSMPDIAEFFGKDHTTILGGIRRAKEIKEREEQLK